MSGDFEEGIAYFVFRDWEVDDGGGDVAEENAADVAAAVFLVLPHVGEDALGVAEGVVREGDKFFGHCAVVLEDGGVKAEFAYGEIEGA